MDLRWKSCSLAIFISIKLILLPSFGHHLFEAIFPIFWTQKKDGCWDAQLQQTRGQSSQNVWCSKTIFNFKPMGADFPILIKSIERFTFLESQTSFQLLITNECVKSIKNNLWHVYVWNEWVRKRGEKQTKIDAQKHLPEHHVLR